MNYRAEIIREISDGNADKQLAELFPALLG